MVESIRNRISSLYTKGGASEVALGIWREAWLQAYGSRFNSGSGVNLLQGYTWGRYVEAKHYIRRLEKQKIGRDITSVRFKQIKDSDTVFILGSGSSINNIADDQWTFISDHDSIGLNNWPFHEFTPTFHVFELPVTSGPGSGHYYWRLLDYRKESYSEIPIIMKDVSRTYYDIHPDNVPDWVSETLLFLPKIHLPSRNIASPDVWFKQMNKSNFFTDKIKYIYQNNASLMYLILLSVKLGYDSIVLCGVDLNDSRYFFQDKQYTDIVDHPYDPERRDTDQTHKTERATAKDFVISEIIRSLDELVLQPRGISIYVENPESALHPTIPHYDIEEKMQ